MRLLQRSYDVDTRYGGGFVQEIDGIGGGREDGRRVDWFYYVNGIEAPVGAASAASPPATASGGTATTGRRPSASRPWSARSPSRSRPGSMASASRSAWCAPATPSAPCDEVTTRLEQAGVKAVPRAVLEQSPGKEVLRVLVGRWAEVRARRRRPAARARPGRHGSLRPADRHGRRDRASQRRRPAGTHAARRIGLVAATSVEAQAPTWIVTGTDDVGVAAAAAALTEERLEQHFALAVEAGRDVPLPVSGAGTGP